MPCKDPTTGCMVMTHQEFWASEAEREGKGREPWELQEDMYREMDEDVHRCEEEFRADPTGALDKIKTYLDGFDSLDEARDEFGFTSQDIVGILHLDDVEVTGGFGSSGLKFIAVLKMTDESTRTIEWEEYQDYGDRINPPDYDEGFAVIAVNGVPVVNKFDRERGDALPLCEECKKHGGPSTRGFRPNTADYLIPVSDDGGQTVQRWVFICSWHQGAGSLRGDYGRWHGPRIRLKQESPQLPVVSKK